MDPTLLLAGLIFLAMLGGGMALAGGPAVNSKRIKGVTQARQARVQNDGLLAAKKRKQVTLDALKELAGKEKKSRKARLSVKGMLNQAGLELPEPAFWIFSVILGGVLGGAAFVAQTPPHVMLGAAFVGAFGVPRCVLKFLIAQRQKKFSTQLADGIEVIVRGVKSGLPLNQCLGIIAQESPAPLSHEFKRLMDAQAMGAPLDQNLQRLHDRMPLPEVNFFNTVILIQQRTGGNLSEALGNLAGVLRSRKLMKEKIKALSGEAVASAMIIGSLPPLVGLAVYFLQPDYIKILFTHQLGQVMLMGGATWMAMGIMVMRKMINFKF